MSPTLTSAQVPQLQLLPLDPEFIGFTYSSLPWNLLFLRASSFIILLSSQIILYENSRLILLILWFTAFGICFNNDFGWLESIFTQVGAELFLLKGLNVPISKLSVTSKKSTISLGLFEFVDRVI